MGFGWAPVSLPVSPDPVGTDGCQSHAFWAVPAIDAPFPVPQPPSPPQRHLQAWHGASWGPLRTHHHAPAPIRVGIYTLISSLGAGRVQPMPASPDFQAGIRSQEGDGVAAAGEVWGWQLGAERAPWQASIPPPAGGAGGNASEEKNAPAAAGPALLKPLVNKAT